MAVYNTGEFLKESIESVINQTIGFENIEIILIDDGSNDDSKDICLTYEKKYPKNIKYVFQENQGQATARNNGMKLAKGKYLNFLDSDDKLKSNALNLVYDFFENHYNDVDVVSIPLKFFDRQNGDHILNYKYEKTRLIDLNKEPEYIQLSASSSFIKKKAIQNHEFDPKLIVSEDAIFVNKILLEKCKHGVVSNTAYLYRKRNIKTSTIDSSIKKKEYYIDRSKLFFKSLFDYSKKKYGRILDFIKYTVMYDIQWMFDISDVSDVLNKNELNQLYDILHDLLNEIDDHIILSQKHQDRSLIKSILLFKHQHIKTLKNSNNYNVIKKVGKYTIDQLYYHVFYIDAVEITNNQLHILGFLKSFFESNELKIEAVKVNKKELMEYWVKYFNENKLAFIKKEYLNPDGENIQNYLINSKNSYNVLNLKKFLIKNPKFNLEKNYDLEEIKEIYNTNLIDKTNYNKLFEKITNIFINYQSNIYEGKYVNYPYRDRKYLNLNYNQSYNFECEVPLHDYEENIIKIRVKYEDLEFYLDIGFNYYSKLTYESFYTKKENYIINFDKNSFNVIPYTNYDNLRFENQNINYLIAKENSDLNEVIEFRKYYYDHFFKYSDKKIWLFMDRPDMASDNGEALYKYAQKQEDGIEKYFIISKNSEDYESLKKIGNIVDFKSKKHKLLSCFAEKIITSHPDDDIINPFSGIHEKYYNGLNCAKICFLQHGIILNNISTWLHKYDKYLSLIVTSTQKEYESFFNNPYNYDKSVVQLLGLPRYDYLKKGNEKNKIVLMPTWRRSLNIATDSEFIESEYYKRWNSILNNKELNDILKKNEFELIFKPHPNVNKFIHLFDLKNTQIEEHSSYRTIFNESKLLITDYSSVTFDFAYLKKPVIYYQWKNDDFHFDLSESYFDYDKMGFGEIVNNESELIELIKGNINNNCQIKEKYVNRINNFYRYNDENNCKRVYDFILNMK